MRVFERGKRALVGAILGAIFGVGSIVSGVNAQDGTPGKPAAAVPAEEVKPAPPIEVPNGSPAELLEFITKTQKIRPQGSDFPAVLANLKRINDAVVAAVDKIGTAGTEAEQSKAISAKLNALQMLNRMGAPGALDKMKAYHKAIGADKRPFVPPLAKIYELATRLQETDRGNVVEIEKLVADVRQHVKTAKLDTQNLSVAFETARMAEAAGMTKEASEAYVEFAAAFATSDDPQVAANAKRLAGAARLLSLPGQAMEVTGKTFEGKAFDLKNLKGKTVLVDFWATWCGPCMAEMPTLRDCYAKYKDRGFEVVGISLDDDRTRLGDFLKREELPWVTIFDDKAKGSGWETPLALQYGIMSIPRAILIDKTGKVISLDAHGDALWDLLAVQIGPAEVKKKEDDEKPAAAEAKPEEKKADEKKPEAK
jgi:thiol-disulfide isomerase/thioredoxin